MIARELSARPTSWPAYVPPPPVRTSHNPLLAFAGPYARDERWGGGGAGAGRRRARRPGPAPRVSRRKHISGRGPAAEVRRKAAMARCHNPAGPKLAADDLP